VIALPVNIAEQMSLLSMNERRCTPARQPDMGFGVAERLIQHRLLRKCASNQNLAGSATSLDVPQPDLQIPLPATKTKLLVVANRLPVTPTKNKDGRWDLQVGRSLAFGSWGVAAGRGRDAHLPFLN
jgi:hypothetical protein